MANKKSFVLYVDSLDFLNELSDVQAGKIFKAIWRFHNGEDTDLKSKELRIVFNWLKNQFIRDGEKYQSTVERNSINGKKGGRPKKINNPSETHKNQEKAKKADTDNDIDNDNVTDNDIAIDNVTDNDIAKDIAIDSNIVNKRNIDINEEITKELEYDTLIKRIYKLHDYEPLIFELREINNMLMGKETLDEKIQVILDYYRDRHRKNTLTLVDTRTQLNSNV
jgi:hypothetical protein